MFGKGVLRVERKTNLARRRTREMFMSIGHVHEIVLEGVIIIIFESAWCKFASDQGDGWTGETCEPVLAKMGADGGSTSKTRSQRRHKRDNVGSSADNGTSSAITVFFDSSTSRYEWLGHL